MSEIRSFSNSRGLVMMVYSKVKFNKEAGGVNRMTLETFQEEYKGHLHELWNWMSLGSYMPPLVKLTEKLNKGADWDSWAYPP